MDIKYSDGAAIETRLLGLVEKADRLESDFPIAGSQYGDWPLEYHLSPERANLLRHLDFSGLDVLELGAGMGAVSRYLAESAKSLTVVEGTRARYAVLQSRLRDLKNWSGIVSNIEDASVPGKFDVVCVVGVLEYSELYVTPPEGFKGGAFAWFLKKAAQWLRPGGGLLLAIENKMGMKYFGGAAEDHTGRLFDGICGYPEGKSVRTFSRAELLGLLDGAGLRCIEEQFPFPDYKVPVCVMTREFSEVAPELAAGLATSRPYRNYGARRIRYFPETLAMRNVCFSRLLPELANSFLYLAAADDASPTLARLLKKRLSGELAWHYSNFRRVPTVTVFKGEPAPRDAARDTPVRVRKEAMRPGESTELVLAGPSLKVRWQPIPAVPAASGLPLRHLFCNHLYFEKPEAAFGLLKDFLEWSVRHWSEGQGRGTVSGQALDATFHNAAWHSESNSYQLFDLEWSLESPMPKSWLVFRNVISLHLELDLSSGKAPFGSRGALYRALCSHLGVSPDATADIEREAELQSLVTDRADVEMHREGLSRLFHRSVDGASYPRRPGRRYDFLKQAVKQLPRRLAIEARDPKLIRKVLSLARTRLMPS